jgi:diguanylate cyclase (GGDEF)-like protein/PAS domain S-box-containing protein
MFAHSVEKRFISIIFAVLILVVAPLFVLFFQLSEQRSAKDAHDRGQMLIEANAQALGKPLWDFDVEGVQQITRAIAANRSVSRVEVRDNTGEIDIQSGEAGGPAHDAGIVFNRTIEYQTVDGREKVGTIEMHIVKQSLFDGNFGGELAIIAIFALSVMIVFTTAIIGNRQLIIKPLNRLTVAIAATRRLGSRHQVDWHSDDEMGALAANFNAMQARLAEEEHEIRAAHARTTETYNRTPAMLYTINADDRLTAVSDYWLLATGYERANAIGQLFQRFVAEDDLETYHARHTEMAGQTADNGVTVKFRMADGRFADMLIMETAIDAGQSAVSLSVMTDVTELKAAEHRNHVQAITDHLTGLLNRQGFETALEQQITTADRQDTGLACLFVDLDRFKWINDTLGHASGDKVLQTIVSRVRDQLRPADTMARLGGDEFAILLAATSPEKAALEVAQRISRVIDKPLDVDGHRINLSASVGIALYPDHARTAAELLQKSDLAMYARKRNGKNGARLFDPELASAARERVRMEADIEDGLREGWFEAHLQPIFNLGTGRIAGFEALMRLNHPEHGLLSPAAIIQIAEETGTIARIGEYIFDRAVSQLARLHAYEEFRGTYVAVNFSPLQFEPALMDRMTASLMKWGVSPTDIVVEITEAVLMHHNPAIQKILAAFGGNGYRLALDDFGTGYSSLSYLHKFPVDIVKIDQSFIRSLTDEEDVVRQKSRMLVEGITAISQRMNCLVVAEGIETAEQRDLLKAIGVNAGQGYHLGRPMPGDAILEKFLDLETKRRA